MTSRIVLFLASGLLCSASTSFVICNSGLATATASGCGPAINSPAANSLLADGNWTLSSNSSGTFLGQAYVTINNSFPLQTSGPWLANNTNDSNGVGAGSSWITPSNNQAANYASGTTSYFSTRFDLTGIPDLSSVVIAGYWLADDYGAGIFLNGVSVVQSSSPAFGGSSGPMVPFTIANGINPGDAVFQSGQNTLTFAVVNDATNHGTVNNPNATPTGIRVLFTESDGNSAPEPGTFAMLGAGLAGCLWARLRRPISREKLPFNARITF